jgi:hypothetical protein
MTFKKITIEPSGNKEQLILEVSYEDYSEINAYSSKELLLQRLRECMDGL